PSEIERPTVSLSLAALLPCLPPPGGRGEIPDDDSGGEFPMIFDKVAAARVLGADRDTDLAVLKVAADHLQPITFADPLSVQVGDVVLAVGDPFGVGQTVPQGIVSATGRNRLGLSTFENFLQTDAAINPGNSGGALVDTKGNLVGVNTAIYSESGGSQ